MDQAILPAIKPSPSTTRLPFRVLIIPYRRLRVVPEYLISKKAGTHCWQSVVGSGENQESPMEAAKRCFETLTQMKGTNWIQLDTQTMLPKTFFKGHENWKQVAHVIPQYCFAVETQGEPQPNIHHIFRWCSGSAAEKLLSYDSNKVAIWEIEAALRPSAGY